MAGRKTIATWIREAISDSDKDEAFSAISLVHMRGSAQDEVHSKKVSAGWNIGEVADMFQSKAETYAQDLPGVQTFKLLAFYGSNDPKAFYPFSVNGLAAHEGMATEAPTQAGSLQQTMRQNEIMFQANQRQMMLIMDQTYRFMQSMAEREMRSREEADDAREMILEVARKQIENNHERAMQEHKYARETGERDRILGLLPALANTITGREVFPQSTADTDLLEKIALAVPPEYVQAMAGQLPPALAGVLMQRFAKVYEDREKALKVKASLPITTSEKDLDS
jgi:hypothetical protein